MAVEGGPTNISLLFLHSSANSAFSDRKPNPGCIAAQLVFLAISIIFSEFK